MGYEPTYWDIGDDDDDLTAMFNDRIRKLVDDNVRDALKDYWSNVRMWVTLNNDGVPIIEAWSSSLEDSATHAVPVADLGGIERDAVDASQFDAIADAFERLSIRARECAAARRELGDD